MMPEERMNTEDFFIMSAESRAHAEHFVKNETPFHLGVLPTEQSNPLTVTLEDDFKRNTAEGIATLQRPDRDVLSMLKNLYASKDYADLADAMTRTLQNGGRICFSGCGATGRLSILLESMWRTACRDLAGTYPALKDLGDRVCSIMTGGDFALVKSVESFEDYCVFGRRQVQEAALGQGDLLVAITEGGETSSVIGTAEEAVERGAGVFLLFNNPASVLEEHVERSRRVIRNPRITVLDLYCGPMALSGSTRMQATTSEQMAAGGALETAFCRIAGITPPDYAAGFEKVLDLLESDEIRSTLAAYIDFEVKVYQDGGKITYLTHDFLLDVFTDTTERSPTFMLPPFRRTDDTVSAQSWAFVKDPLFSTPDAWQNAMARDLRCLNWTMADYEAMGVTDRITSAPAIGTKDLLAFPIGNEPSPERAADSADTVVTILMGEETCDAALLGSCAEIMKQYPAARTFCVGSPVGDFAFPAITLSCQTEQPLRLLDHIVLKLILNTISTGVMVKYGRVSGNWMSFVALSNKKLIDRGIRLVSGLGKISYEDAAYLIFDAMEQTENMRTEKGERICAVQYALANIGR